MKWLLALTIIPLSLFGECKDPMCDKHRFIMTGLTFEPLDKSYFVNIHDNIEDIDYFYELNELDYTPQIIEDDIFQVMIWESPICVLWSKE